MPPTRRDSPRLAPEDVLLDAGRFVVICKPSQIAVHRGWDGDPITAVALVRRLLRRKLDPVHRLDRGTSGALLFSADRETTIRLQAQFHEGRVHKQYLALTRGILKEEQGLIDHPVPRRPKEPRVPAQTRYHRIGVALDRYSLVLAEPLTGRLHQLRRHFKHLSHPLMGDTRYGDGRENRRLREELGLHRLALHALRLRFEDPHTGSPIDLYAPPPEDLSQPLQRAGLEAELWRDRNGGNPIFPNIVSIETEKSEVNSI